MARLSDLGFQKNIIVETIVSTCNFDGYPNAAPMGVLMEDEKTLLLNIYNNSITCLNLKASRSAVVNVVSSIELFYKTALKETNPDSKLSQDLFCESENVCAPKLRQSEASLGVAVLDEQIKGEKTCFTCQVNWVEAVKGYPQVYCRAFGATLEAIVHATRVKVFLGDPEKEAQVSLLFASIESCFDVVKRTAPDSIYFALMSDLLHRIEGWRQRQ
jgi:hypothetical protein